MDFGPKLLDWLISQKPQEQEIEIPALLQGASVLPDSDDDRMVIVRKYENGAVFCELQVRKENKIWWKTTVSAENGKATFVPELYWMGMSGEKEKAVAEIVLKNFGAIKKEVSLPEKVTYLPIPSAWTEAECCNGCCNSASPFSRLCFASEALQMISEFEIELGKAKEELK